MLSIPWNAWATAAPVSPDVAVKIVTFLFSLNACKHLAIKRAPKSLKASVGPWNNSNIARFSLIGCICAGKLKASVTISVNCSSVKSSLTNGYNTLTLRSTIGSASKASILSKRGNSSGKNNPWLRPKPCFTAPAKLTCSSFSFKL